jgi:ABC-type lipoprotein export system ATPase subunit
VLKNIVLKACDIWKDNGLENGSCRWLLQGVNLEVLEGEFVAILGGPAAGKSTLLKIIGFRESPGRGTVYFEGRLVGRGGGKELAKMQNERVWLIAKRTCSDALKCEPALRPAVVLLDDPLELHDSGTAELLLRRIGELTGAGTAVVLATRKAAVASRAAAVYRLSGGMLKKITSN